MKVPCSAELQVIRKPIMPVIDDSGAAVTRALELPVGSDGGIGSLKQLAERSKSACIAICDITRPVPNRLFLRPAIETLLAAGMNADSITVLVATGLHRPNEGDELRELVGDDWVLDNIRVVNHVATNDNDHVELGRTSTRGTPVKIDRRFVDADLRIATGLIEPHFMAGYSGGRKVIAPGLAHADTIRTFHNHAFMSNPAAKNCNLDENPLHEEQLQIVKMLGGAFAINTVIDEDRNLSFVNFGEILASHAEAVEFVQQYCCVDVDRRFDVVVTSAAGYPLDQTYYQTVKGMVGAIDILKQGGDLFIVAECSEGIGSADYLHAQRRLGQLGDDGFIQSLQGKNLADIDEWQTQMQTKATRVGTVHLYSKLDDSLKSLTGVRTYHSVEEFQTVLNDAIERSNDRSIAAIPEGPYVIPRVAG
ncbi:MAG: nickel-dependent lactate racemase [Planctomycetales bacterium]|nr:nickel-dependent lactate racemase [Planctomycetales bacterium]